jgi:hypothetical protein
MTSLSESSCKGKDLLELRTLAIRSGDDGLDSKNGDDAEVSFDLPWMVEGEI